MSNEESSASKLNPADYGREVSTDPRQGATLDSVILTGRGVPVEIERRQFAALLRIEDLLVAQNAYLARLVELGEAAEARAEKPRAR